VSSTTRKRSADGLAGLRDRAAAGAQRAMPAAKNAIPKAVPIARNAGTAVRHSAEDAAAWARPRVDEVTAWAKPRVDDARSWAAPRLERSGHAVQETLAPAISEAMISTARRLEVKPARKPRGWAKMLAVAMLIAAAASAAAAAVMRRRPAEFGYAQDGNEPDEMKSAEEMPAPQNLAEANGTQPDAEVSGQTKRS
jgi:hypothetical protein